MSTAATPSIFDTQSLSKLRTGLRQDDPQALKAAAQQFEAVFLQMVLKSMRATAPQSGLFDSDQTRFYQELLDSQLAQVMAAKGGTGLAAMIEKQLSRPTVTEETGPASALPLVSPARALPIERSQRSLPLPDDRTPAALPLNGSPVRPDLPRTQAPANGNAQTQSFTAAVWPQAVAASREIGVPAHFLVAQAALESGWGKSEPRFADGRPSYNLFGIKAGPGWQGAVVEATTTEVVNGVVEKRVERFRAYGSYAEAFQDHARLLAQSPRYAAVVGRQDAASFAQGLQRAGYATDPMYAAKIERIIAGLATQIPTTPRA